MCSITSSLGCLSFRALFILNFKALEEFSRSPSGKLKDDFYIIFSYLALKKMNLNFFGEKLLLIYFSRTLLLVVLPSFLSEKCSFISETRSDGLNWNAFSSCAPLGSIKSNSLILLRSHGVSFILNLNKVFFSHSKKCWFWKWTLFLSLRIY